MAHVVLCCKPLEYEQQSTTTKTPQLPRAVPAPQPPSLNPSAAPYRPPPGLPPSGPTASTQSAAPPAAPYRPPHTRDPSHPPNSTQPTVAPPAAPYRPPHTRDPSHHPPNSTQPTTAPPAAHYRPPRVSPPPPCNYTVTCAHNACPLLPATHTLIIGTIITDEELINGVGGAYILPCGMTRRSVQHSRTAMARLVDREMQKGPNYCLLPRSSLCVLPIRGCAAPMSNPLWASARQGTIDTLAKKVAPQSWLSLPIMAVLDP